MQAKGVYKIQLANEDAEEATNVQQAAHKEQVHQYWVKLEQKEDSKNGKITS